SCIAASRAMVTAPCRYPQRRSAIERFLPQQVLMVLDMYLTVPPASLFFNDTPTTDIYTLSLHDALPILQNRVASNIGISQSTFSVKVLNLFSRSRRKTNKRKSKHSAMLRNKETRHRMFIGLLNTTRKLA